MLKYVLLFLFGYVLAGASMILFGFGGSFENITPITTLIGVFMVVWGGLGILIRSFRWLSRKLS